MKINRSRRPSKKLIAIALVSLVIVSAAGLGAYALFGSDSADNKGVVKPVRKDGHDTVEIKDRPIGDIDNSTPTDEESNPATDKLPTQPNANAKGAIPVLITHADGAPLQIRTVINEILTNGTCSLSLQKSGQQTVTKSAEIFAVTSYTTCKGFTVDTSHMAKGVWEVNVTVKSGERTGSATKEVTI
jgi:hypothetical protein